MSVPTHDAAMVTISPPPALCVPSLDEFSLVNECVAECDQRAVLGALETHVAKTDQPDHKRLDKVSHITLRVLLP